MSKLALPAAALSAIALGACYEDATPAPPPQPPVMVPASGVVLSPAQASSILGAATCDREARCNGIGPGARYGTYDQCVGINYQQAMQSFQTCEYGIKDRELRACHAEVQQHACGGPLGSLEWFQRAVTCRTANLCLR
jgi:hypothetical protein